MQILNDQILSPSRKDRLSNITNNIDNLKTESRIESPSKPHHTSFRVNDSQDELFAQIEAKPEKDDHTYVINEYERVLQ